MSEISKLEQSLTIKKIDEETINISINDNEMLMAIVGQFDQNLKNLSKLTDTNVYFRGNSITCKGEKEKLSNISNITDKEFDNYLSEFLGHKFLYFYLFGI